MDDEGGAISATYPKTNVYAIYIIFGYLAAFRFSLALLLFQDGYHGFSFSGTGYFLALQTLELIPDSARSFSM